MIEDLRFVDRSVPMNEAERLRANIGQPYIDKTVKILQAYDGHQWFDVPLVAQQQEKR